jgi:pimeloyl-ACP methyl ester carboxylesterase
MRRALFAVAFIVGGSLLVLPRPYHERTFLIEAGGCQLQTTVIDARAIGARADARAIRTGGGDARGAASSNNPLSAESPTGTVVLFHGLAANRKLMSYLAYGFANLGLRVFVPDLPGHGRTEGAFSAARDEECGENLLHELRSRGMAPPESTILAGHSMGGAMAIRIAARVPVAGVIAISPAPMRAAHGASADVLVFNNPPPLPPNTEIISGALEPQRLTANAKDLLQPGVDVNSHFDVIPWATHGGLLFRPQAVRLSQAWATKVLRLNTPVTPSLPSRLPLLGCVLGLVGMLSIAGPFLQEAVGKGAFGQIDSAPRDPSSHAAGSQVLWWRAAAEILLVGLLVVTMLRYWMPLRLLRIFEGDYLAGYLLFAGVLLIAMHWQAFTGIFDFRNASALRAILAAAVLFLLFSAWLELSVTEAWLDRAHWQRFPLLFFTVLPGLIAEELLLGPLTAKPVWKRLSLGLCDRLLFWLPLVFGILVLHSAEILLVLLAPYLAVFSIAHRRAMDVVREVTSSAAAAALFGAILLAGFFLVIFPLL